MTSNRFKSLFSLVGSVTKSILLSAGLIVTVFFTGVNSSWSEEVVHHKPQRIASTHLCTDQLLLMLSDHDRIVSLSFFSHDPGMSAMSEIAKNFPINHGFAEELVALDPDLILTSTFGHSSILLLQRLGYQVSTIPVADSPADIVANIYLVAQAIGEPERGEELAASFLNRIESVKQQQNQHQPTLAIYNQNGVTFGNGALITQLVELAGFRNLGAELGLGTAQHLPLELLLVHQPDALMLGDRNRSAAMANELPNHPALRRKYENVPRIDMQSHLWICGTPYVADALEYLAEQRISLAQ